VTVNAAFPGANATRRFSRSVAASIEQQVNGAQDMLYMSSKSGNDGTYSLTVTFEIAATRTSTRSRCRTGCAIAQPQLPAEVIRNGITVRKATSDLPGGDHGSSRRSAATTTVFLSNTRCSTCSTPWRA